MSHSHSLEFGTPQCERSKHIVETPTKTIRIHQSKGTYVPNRGTQMPKTADALSLSNYLGKSLEIFHFFVHWLGFIHEASD